MTDNESRGAKRVTAARERTQSGFGKGPVLAAAGVAVVLAAMLIPSGIGVANALSAPPLAVSSKTPSHPGTGAKTPGADPSALPDRSSDPTPTPTPADRIYNILPGDTLTSISAKLGMSVDSIAAYNAVRNVDVISAGSVLRVPFIYVPPKADANG
jgi:LysM repeat protein